MGPAKNLWVVPKMPKGVVNEIHAGRAPALRASKAERNLRIHPVQVRYGQPATEGGNAAPWG